MRAADPRWSTAQGTHDGMRKLRRSVLNGAARYAPTKPSGSQLANEVEVKTDITAQQTCTTRFRYVEHAEIDVSLACASWSR